MPQFSKRRFAATLGVWLVMLGLVAITARGPQPPGSPYSVLAVMLGVVVTMTIWRIVLSLLMRKRWEALWFGLCIPVLLLAWEPFREATVRYWPLLLGVTAVLTTGMMWRWLGPTREHFAALERSEGLGRG
jgi:hypothetical protein